MPGIFDVPPGSDPTRQPAIPDDALWEDFIAYDDNNRDLWILDVERRRH